jgi:hypothetical protein
MSRPDECPKCKSRDVYARVVSDVLHCRCRTCWYPWNVTTGDEQLAQRSSPTHDQPAIFAAPRA